MKKLVQPRRVEEVSQALRPTVFELREDIYQLLVVFKLRVHNFDVLLVLLEQ
jgi:hypothetical protein